MPTKASSSLASSLIESIAVLILKTRLARYDRVDVQVDASPLGLIQGKVEGVTIEGTEWASPVALTSRYLHFSLGRTAIDYQALLMERRINLLPPKPEGRATILFSASDFGNLLVHPLFKAEAAKAVRGSPFDFDGASVRIKEGSVLFSGDWNGESYDLCLNPSKNQSSKGCPDDEVMVRLTAANKRSGEEDALITSELASFFNNLCMDLQGLQLRFSSLDVVRSSIRDPLLLEMKLKANLIEVPPLNVKF